MAQFWKTVSKNTVFMNKAAGVIPSVILEDEDEEDNEEYENEDEESEEDTEEDFFDEQEE